ncbi:TPA: hypothetical protein DIU27_05280 [Candidatus Collierbacteria bacterium]|nr:MAG: hypothetical protein UW88_C0010G0020 [Candidatus Collierbacteria bacterium GW2011_GWD2_45_10]HCQ31755.1 hypothetical protein [Candidatus Collierbacteria bacterium]
MKKFLINTLAVIAIIVTFGLFFQFFAWTGPAILKPGDEIAVMTGKTVILDGQPCAENNHGYVSPTGPEGTLGWYKPERLIFPLFDKISVIYADGKTEWVTSKYIVKLPADHDRFLCPAPE